MPKQTDLRDGTRPDSDVTALQTLISAITPRGLHSRYVGEELRVN